MPDNWTEEKLLSYLNPPVEENLNLDYKAAAALKKESKAQAEITKDVSAMANSAGGVLIYGIAEGHTNRHLPERLDPVDRTTIPKEWLEHVIRNVQPPIDGLVIHPVQLSSGPNHVAYVVEVPQSTTAHQAQDYRYYKRHNFESVPMEDYEIRDIMGRQKHPLFSVEFRITLERRYLRHFHHEDKWLPEGKQHISACNVGSVLCEYIHLSLLVPHSILSPDSNYTDFAKEGDVAYGGFGLTNTVRDVVERVIDIPKYGPSRYAPILPGLSYRWFIKVNPDPNRISSEQHPINWKLFADNAPLKEGTVVVASIPVKNDL